MSIVGRKVVVPLDLPNASVIPNKQLRNNIDLNKNAKTRVILRNQNFSVVQKF